ncbi:MAG: RdgB/HAM1 family non-canonical purine NTP pyrophosphatase [Dehalococcoidia bacterium]
MEKLLLATNNPGKVREFSRLLSDVPFTVVTPAELGLQLDVVEDGTTYAENAAKKARAFAAAGGCWALADDSGIEVDALDGAPGLYSARFGWPALDDTGRYRLLLLKLFGVPDAQRTARYRAIVAVASPDGEVHDFEATFEGHIGHGPHGDRGFGYDPIFVTADGRTAAELPDVAKDAQSHRGKAVRAAAEYLRTVCR